MPDFENLPLNPWLLAGTVMAVITVIFYIGRWVGGINAFKSGAVSTLVNLLEEIRDDIRTLLERVPAVHIARGSPLRLTDLGRTVSEALDAQTWMATLADELGQRTAEDMSPYDVQEFCFSYMREDFAPTLEQSNRIKACAYDNGLGEQDVLEILAIELRDTLLATVAQRKAVG